MNSPLSRYRTVEFLEKLGSKFAMSGAIYCVAVSMRCVICPVKINPIQILRIQGLETFILFLTEFHKMTVLIKIHILCIIAYKDRPFYIR